MKAPDLVVLDDGLPDMYGFEVLRWIRSTSQVPVIKLTARTKEIDRVVGLTVGADDYVTKPFSPRELVARISAVAASLKRNALLFSSASIGVITPGRGEGSTFTIGMPRL